MAKSRYGSLALPDVPPVTLFRAIDDILRADPTIKAVIKGPESFRSWQGKPSDKNELAVTQAPAIRLSIASGREDYWYPGSSKANLRIQVEALVTGTCSDDVHNLFGAIRRALTPQPQTALLALHQKLKAAGAATGLVFFVWPQVATNDADAGFQLAIGGIEIEFKDT